MDRKPAGVELRDYDFDLPDAAIALRPAVPRDAARLLVSHPDAALADAVVRDLPAFLRPGDLLVVNDSRVIPARLAGVRLSRALGQSAASPCADLEGSGARVDLTLLALEKDGLWRAFARPAKRLAAGDTLMFAPPAGAAPVAPAGEAGQTARPLTGTVIARDGPTVHVRFDADPLVAGAMPLPPYIAARRAPDERDTADYQTVYADPPGSVAAPTAGLHFTPALLDRLAEGGVGVARVTLHVGAGTFLPVTADRLDAHEMHAEAGMVAAATVDAIRAARAAGGRIVAVGTTALRLIESAASTGELTPFRGETKLFIRPPFRFRVADALLTNFHLPRSTLLVLVAAFVGLDRMRAIYAHAVAEGYRFYSYGDASLLFPDKP